MIRLASLAPSLVAVIVGCASERPTIAACEAQPRDGRSCDANLDEVCGCDAVTYGNECEAAAHGVDVAHEGACLDGIVA